jgi:hypothetical protein
MPRLEPPRRYTGAEIARLCVSKNPEPNVEGQDRVWLLAGEVEAMVLEDAQIFNGLCEKTEGVLRDIAQMLEDGGDPQEAARVLRLTAQGFEHPARTAESN